MAINRKDFAEECVQQGLRFGVPSHYLMAAAQLRSGISDESSGERISAFRLTQQEWDANCSDQEQGITDFLSTDVKDWDMQCCIYALMTLRAQNRILARLGRLPNAVELYKEQWPDDPVELPGKMQEALDATAELVDPAFEEVTGEPPTQFATIDDAEDPAISPDSDPNKPVPKKGQELFVLKAPRIMEKLIDDFHLRDFQAAGILGNLGHECNGFLTMQEKKPQSGRGGFGWAQWTASRRVAFESFCKEVDLSPVSDAANYRFLKLELGSSHKSAIAQLKNATTLEGAVRAFEEEFEKAAAGKEHFERRDEWAKLALKTFKTSAQDRVPAMISSILEADNLYSVVATAQGGGSAFWVINQLGGEDGAQILVQQEIGKDPVVLLRDTVIFPIKDGLVPPMVKKKLSADFEDASDPGPINTGPVASDDDIRAKLFAKAKDSVGKLISRNVPDTKSGQLACAWAVNEVARQAIGKKIGGGLSTIAMGKVLKSKHTLVPEANISEGMIVISPTGAKVGHVGVVGAGAGDARLIYSNSSNAGVFAQNFTVGTWKARYIKKQHLPVLFYQLKK
jgi:hypothetical protein